VSLLLKALKQAEATHNSPSAPPADLELEPVTPAPGKQGREWVEPPGLLFGSSGLTPAPEPKRAFRWPQLSLVPLTALIAVVVAIGYGVYLYIELQPASVPPPASRPVTAPVAQASLDESATPSAAIASEAPSPKALEPVKPGMPGEAVEKPRPIAVKPVQPASSAPRPPSTSIASAASADRPVGGTSPRFLPDAYASLLNNAYAAYQRGQLAEAEQLYTEAAARQRSTDALLGLAAIAASRNRENDAARLYREILERDPRNADAQAALLDLLGNTDSQATESRLKTLIDREPSPHLYQTLGNLYADQRRWVDAQSAYFEAYRGAPDNADYAFNLAVSLDQLRQHAAALGYYDKALAAGGNPRFDRAQAEARVRQLRALP